MCQECNTDSRRNSIDIFLDILDFCQTPNQKKPLMHLTNINFRQLKDIF
jgi:predicted transcriptional regulator